MTLPNQRSGEILNKLLSITEPIVVKTLAEKFSVSSRTIRSDLKKLDNWLRQKNIKLVKKPGVGVWLEINSYQRATLEKVLFKEVDNEIATLLPATRQQYILNYLFQMDKTYTMKELAEKLYVSPATIYKDLKKVRKWLTKYNLSLKRDQGIEVKGAEQNWRRAVADLLFELKDNQELKEKLEKEIDLTVDVRMNYYIYYQLKRMFDNPNIKIIEDLLKGIEKELDFNFTKEAFMELVVHIVISISRSSKNKIIEIEEKELIDLKNKDEFKIANVIVKKLEDKFKIEIHEHEIYYIFLHILGAKSQKNVHTEKVTDVLENSTPQIVEVAQEIIAMSEQILNVDFRDDKQLLVGLILHLKPTINRLKYGMSLRNPLLNRIKNNYARIFGAACTTNEVFKKHLGIEANEEEIGYITLHLAGALERINQRLKAIIVFSSGIATYQLVVSKLNKRLPNLEIIDVISMYELEDEKLANIDLIISTVTLGDLPKPVVEVSPLLTDNDINLVKNKFDNILQHKQNEKVELKLKDIRNILDDELIFANLELDSKDQVIKFLTEKLLQKNNISQRFMTSIVEKNNFTSIQTAGKGAILHGIEERYVLNSAIAIVTLTEPIKWGNREVDVIFLPVLKRHKRRDLFEHFYMLLNNQEVLDKIRKIKDKQGLKEIILNKKYYTYN